jgi:hypothetical protein
MFPVLLICASCALIWLVRDPLVRVVAVAPLVCTVALFAVWQGSLAENYWYLPCATSAALCLVGWISGIASSVRRPLAAVLVLGAIALQPSNAHYTWNGLRTPIYGTLVRASRALRESGVPVREISTAFAMPADTDAGFVYSILGGRLAPASSQRAVLTASGAVQFESLDPPADGKD